jgi:hypothetical protein
MQCSVRVITAVRRIIATAPVAIAFAGVFSGAGVIAVVLDSAGRTAAVRLADAVVAPQAHLCAAGLADAACSVRAGGRAGGAPGSRRSRARRIGRSCRAARSTAGSRRRRPAPPRPCRRATAGPPAPTAAGRMAVSAKGTQSALAAAEERTGRVTPPALTARVNPPPVGAAAGRGGWPMLTARESPTAGAGATRCPKR